MNSRLMALVDARLHRVPVVATASRRKVWPRPCQCVREHLCSAPAHWWQDTSTRAQSRRAKRRWHGSGDIDLGPRDRRICRRAARGVSLSRIGRQERLTRQRCGQIVRREQSAADIRAFQRGENAKDSLRSRSYPWGPSSVPSTTGERYRTREGGFSS